MKFSYSNLFNLKIFELVFQRGFVRKKPTTGIVHETIDERIGGGVQINLGNKAFG
jgi:hypothetical protein